MKFLLSVAVLVASATLADTQVPKQGPALPKVPPTQASPYQLAFSAQPTEVPDVTAWVPSQGEATITNNSVVATVAKGGDPILTPLVARRVCDPAVNECAFLTRFAYIDEAPADMKSRVALRYAIRGPSGTRIEGFAYTPTRDHKDYRFWRRVDGAWLEETAVPERDVEMHFVGQLTQLVVALDQRGQFPFSN